MPGTKIELKVGEDSIPIIITITVVIFTIVNRHTDHHVKVGEDPDPAPFLFVSQEIKERIAAKVYDPKRSAYVPHPEEKFAEVIIFSNHYHR